VGRAVRRPGRSGRAGPGWTAGAAGPGVASGAGRPGGRSCVRAGSVRHRFFDPLLLRDTALDRRRSRGRPRRNARELVTRRTSAPSDVPATARTYRPRSIPTQPLPCPVGRAGGAGWVSSGVTSTCPGASAGASGCLDTCRREGCRSVASTVIEIHHRFGPRVTVTNRIRARLLAIIRRNRRVSSRTRKVPIFGRLTDRGRSPSPRRMLARPLLVLFRIRNDPPAGSFFLNLGNPTRGPSRAPVMESLQAFNARPRSTTASSKTCARTSPRHTSPVTSTRVVPSRSTTNRRPAASDTFHALNALIRSNPDHDTPDPLPEPSTPEPAPSPSDTTFELRSRPARASASLCNRNAWLNANRAAPTCRDSTRSCKTDGSRRNRNDVCLATHGILPPTPDNIAHPFYTAGRTRHPLPDHRAIPKHALGFVDGRPTSYPNNADIPHEAGVQVGAARHADAARDTDDPAIS